MKYRKIKYKVIKIAPVHYEPGLEFYIILFGFDFFPKIVVHFVAFFTKVRESFKVFVLRKIWECDSRITDIVIFNQFSCCIVGSRVGNLLKVNKFNVGAAHEVDKLFCVLNIFSIF